MIFISIVDFFLLICRALASVVLVLRNLSLFFTLNQFDFSANTPNANEISNFFISSFAYFSKRGRKLEKVSFVIVVVSNIKRATTILVRKSIYQNWFTSFTSQRKKDEGKREINSEKKLQQWQEKFAKSCN